MTIKLPRCMFGASLATALVTALVCTSGCRVPEDDHWRARDTPLDVDPTDYVQVAGWWSNGQELLHFEGDGRYWLYDSPTHAHPLHRGRWGRHTHTRLKLEPHTDLNVEPLSVEILRGDDGEFELRLPGYRDFHRTIAPDPPLRIQPPAEPISSTA